MTPFEIAAVVIGVLALAVLGVLEVAHRRWCKDHDTRS